MVVVKHIRLLFLFLILIPFSGCNLPRNSPPTFLPPPAYATPTFGPSPTSPPTTAPTVTSAPTSIPNTAVIPTETSIPTPTFTSTPFPTPTQVPTNTPVPTPSVNQIPFTYKAQAGDTLSVVATHFGVLEEDIKSEQPIPQESFINPGQILFIPRVFINFPSKKHLLPDSEFVYSPAIIRSSDFPEDVVAYVEQAGGYLSTYSAYLTTTKISGGEIVAQIAENNSVNPYLLLALLEYQSGWVFGQPSNLRELKYPLGHVDYEEQGLVRQLRWAVNQLSIGYYGWREGRLTEIHLSSPQKEHQDITARIYPELNAGTVALQYFFSQVKDSSEWIQAVNYENGFPAKYREMFGDPEPRRRRYEPLFPPNLKQPAMALPFRVGSSWDYTGGPHGAWEREGSWSAIDFGPPSISGGCVKSSAYVTASMSGKIVRAGNGVVTIDRDGDMNEQTDWVLLYLHIAEDGLRVQEGDDVQIGDKLGHPSCEGGLATGTHVHLARKYNGEWMEANGPIPFVLSGWTVQSGEKPYEGSMIKDGQTVIASPVQTAGRKITRKE